LIISVEIPKPSQSGPNRTKHDRIGSDQTGLNRIKTDRLLQSGERIVVGGMDQTVKVAAFDSDGQCVVDVDKLEKSKTKYNNKNNKKHVSSLMLSP